MTFINVTDILHSRYGYFLNSKFALSTRIIELFCHFDLQLLLADIVQLYVHLKSINCVVSKIIIISRNSNINSFGKAILLATTEMN